MKSIPALRRRPASAAAKLTPHVKIFLECDGEHVFCGGLAQILRAVEETGSIKQAASQVGRSYRAVWNRIKAAERALNRQLVETHVGGADKRRSSLTVDAHNLLATFQDLRQRLSAIVGQEFAAALQANPPGNGRRNGSPTARAGGGWPGAPAATSAARLGISTPDACIPFLAPLHWPT